MIPSLRGRLQALGTVVDEFREDSRQWILLVVACGWGLSIGVRLIYPAVLPYLRNAFGIDLSMAGLLLTVLWSVYALGQLPGGLLADSIGSGHVLALSTALSTVALVLVLVSPSVWLLFGATALLGLCTALYGTARFPLLTAVFPKRDGTAIGLTQATGNLANTLFPFIAGVLSSAIAWQFGFGFVVPLFLAVAVAHRIVVPERPENPSSALDTESTDLFDGLTSRAVLVAVSIQVLGSTTYQGVTGFYATYLVQTKGVSPGVAALLFGGFFAFGMIVQPITGAANDRFGERGTLMVVLGFSMIALLALPFVSGLPGLVAITIVLSSMLGRPVVALTYLTNALPEDIRGTGMGVLRTGYIMIGALSPLVIGILADSGYFDEAFLSLAVASGLTLLLCLVLPELE